MKKLPMIQHDKANHFIYGLFIFMIVSILVNVYLGFGVCIVAACTKEVYDLYSTSHTADVYDVLWTIFGGIAGLIIAYFL